MELHTQHQGEPDFLSAKSVGMVNAVGEYPNPDNISTA
jgi:hypothetical protein